MHIPTTTSCQRFFLGPPALGRYVFIYFIANTNSRHPSYANLLSYLKAQFVFSIPRGTLIIMSTQDASLKESNYEDAKGFHPERWLQTETDSHAFASIPFGFGARKCMAQNIAEAMMSVLTVRVS